MHVCQEEKGRGTGSAVLLDHLIGERGGRVNQGGGRRRQPRREEATERDVSKVAGWFEYWLLCCGGSVVEGRIQDGTSCQESLMNMGKRQQKCDHEYILHQCHSCPNWTTDRQATQGLLPTCLQLISITTYNHICYPLYPSHAHNRRLVLSWFGLAVLWQSVRPRGVVGSMLFVVACVCVFLSCWESFSRLQVAFLQQDQTTQKAFESPLNKGLILNLFRIDALSHKEQSEQWSKNLNLLLRTLPVLLVVMRQWAVSTVLLKLCLYDSREHPLAYMFKRRSLRKPPTRRVSCLRCCCCCFSLSISKWRFDNDSKPNIVVKRDANRRIDSPEHGLQEEKKIIGFDLFLIEIMRFYYLKEIEKSRCDSHFSCYKCRMTDAKVGIAQARCRLYDKKKISKIDYILIKL